MENLFKGICFDENGYHTPAVGLDGVEEAILYCILHGGLHHEIRITDDTQDSTVMQVIKGVFVWPELLKGKRITEFQYVPDEGL